LTRQFITDVGGVASSPSPISHAVVLGNQCWVSGQLSVDEHGRYVPGNARDEAKRAFDNIFAILKAAGFDQSAIVYVDIAFIDLDDLPEVNALCAELFPEGKRPARTIYQAARLPFDGRIKVQAIAAREPQG